MALYTGTLGQHLDPGPDGSFGQLQLADIGLRQQNQALCVPVEDKGIGTLVFNHPCRQDRFDFVRVPHSAIRFNDVAAQQFGDRFNGCRTADTERWCVVDDQQL